MEAPAFLMGIIVGVFLGLVIAVAQAPTSSQIAEECYKLERTASSSATICPQLIETLREEY